MVFNKIKGRATSNNAKTVVLDPESIVEQQADQIKWEVVQTWAGLVAADKAEQMLAAEVLNQDLEVEMEVHQVEHKIIKTDFSE